MRKTTQKEDKRQGIDKNENRDMIEAVAALAKEKNISKELLFSAIEEALKSAYKNNFSKEYGMPPSNANVRVELNRETGAVRLYARKTVERWPTDEATEISIEEAQAIQPSYQQDDIVEVEVTPDNFRRVAAQTAKQVIVQKIREAERGKVYDDFIEKENEILTAIVHSVDPETKDVYVELGKTEGVLEPSQQMATCMRRASALRSTCWKSSRIAVWRVRARSTARRLACPVSIRVWLSACSSWKCRKFRAALCRSSPFPARRAAAQRWLCIPPTR